MKQCDVTRGRPLIVATLNSQELLYSYLGIHFLAPVLLTFVCRLVFRKRLHRLINAHHILVSSRTYQLLTKNYFTHVHNVDTRCTLHLHDKG